MKGTRPLDNKEIRQVAKHFDGTFALRNRCLFIIGVSTGGRISELLSLTVKDVWQNGHPITDLVFGKNIVKGGELSRSVPLNSDGQKAVEELVTWVNENYQHPQTELVSSDCPLFPSRNKNNNGEVKSMTRKAAHNAFKNAFEAAGLNGKLATHSLRKSYAQRLYEQTSDIYIIKEMLGHKSVDTTQKYLGVKYVTVREASEAMALSWDEQPRNITPIYRATDDELLLEMVRRGYRVEKQENTTE